MKQFELWLDESGSFNENGESREYYSFVGGVLVSKDNISEFDFDTFLNRKDLNHAMKMNHTDKKTYVIPKLLEFKSLTNARYVYFENIELFGTGDNRSLYLQVMAEGLLQLWQLLESQYGAVQLDIVIASRVAQKGDSPHVHIEENEYQRFFEEIRKKKIEENSFKQLQISSINFHLERATLSNKLILADFACNIRRQRGKSRFKNSESRLQFQQLFTDAYRFSMSELSSDTHIRVLLSQNDISEAVMEVFTSDSLSNSQKENYIQLILTRITHTNYRLLKSQMKQLASEVLSYTARQDHYDVSIKLLNAIRETFIPHLQSTSCPYEQLFFEILLQLADAYLRSGQLFLAYETITELFQGLQDAKSSLENLFILYRTLEKLAVFYIDSVQFNQAVKLMEQMRQTFDRLFLQLGEDVLINQYFDELYSEYYGDVLCMEIYARLFRKQKMTEKEQGLLLTLSDKALKQYPNFQGELERHRQYRSRIELAFGRHKEAFSWLLAAIDYQLPEEREIDSNLLKYFLDKVYEQEHEMSQAFYLLYYTLILSSAVKTDEVLADTLHQALMTHPISELVVRKSSVKGEIELVKSYPNFYHPLEIVCWNIAEYYRHKGEDKLSLIYYDEAITICSRKNNTISLQLTLVVILVARASLELSKNARTKVPKSGKRALSCLQSLKDKIAPMMTGTNTAFFSELASRITCWEDQLTDILKLEEDMAQALYDFSQEWRY